MPNAKRQLGLVSVILLLCFGSSLCAAHVLRVAQLNIEELGSGHYVMRYEVPVGEESIYPLPILPKHASWQALPKHLQGLLQLQFYSEKGLHADDTILLPWKRSGAIVTMVWANGSGARQFFSVSEQGISVPLAELQAGSGNTWNTAKRYIGLGIHHILIGIDHLFFVAALLLLVSSRAKLLWAVTFFTIAHSITLALAVLDVVRIPTPSVEWLIALSIVLMAKEVLRAQQGFHGLAWQRPWIVSFAFGLVHGLGFAAALGDLGLPNESIPQILLFFNLGVELGQIAFILCAWLLIALMRRVSVPWPAQLQQVPAYIIGSTAMMWLLLRSEALFS